MKYSVIFYFWTDHQVERHPCYECKQLFPRERDLLDHNERKHRANSPAEDQSPPVGDTHYQPTIDGDYSDDTTPTTEPPQESQVDFNPSPHNTGFISSANSDPPEETSNVPQSHTYAQSDVVGAVSSSTVRPKRKRNASSSRMSGTNVDQSVTVVTNSSRRVNYRRNALSQQHISSSAIVTTDHTVSSTSNVNSTGNSTTMQTTNFVDIDNSSSEKELKKIVEQGGKITKIKQISNGVFKRVRKWFKLL